MIKVAPSILSADFAHLGRDIEAISTADYVHVDVMDGLFVPNISIGIPVVKSIRPTTTLPLDVHLMIDRPVRYVEQFCDAGGDLITCHVEADTEENIHAAIDKIHGIFQASQAYLQRWPARWRGSRGRLPSLRRAC